MWVFCFILIEWRNTSRLNSGKGDRFHPSARNRHSKIGGMALDHSEWASVRS